MDMAKIQELWDQALNKSRKQKNKNLMDNEPILFFKINNEIFGYPEESRQVFAKLRNDTEENEAWYEEAGFIGLNLTRGVNEDHIPKRIFYKKSQKNFAGLCCCFTVFSCYFIIFQQL